MLDVGQLLLLLQLLQLLPMHRRQLPLLLLLPLLQRCLSRLKRCPQGLDCRRRTWPRPPPLHLQPVFHHSVA